LTVRDRNDALEVLMLRRNLNSDFVGGAYVFPGGGVDASDATRAAEERVVGLNDVDASRRLGLESGGLAYYVAALRETFEEAGLLVACDRDGAPVEIDDARRQRLTHERRALNNRETTFLEILARESLHLDVRDVGYFAHWVTPVGPPRRYDTRFFVVPAPLNQRASHDAGETIADLWVRPAEALAAHGRGEFEMIFPTIRTLESIAHCTSVAALVAQVGALTSIPKNEPVIIDGEPRLASEQP
jgi:8-oxo-dGTP pyrophosphatase MutT (NUDIX family)